MKLPEFHTKRNTSSLFKGLPAPRGLRFFELGMMMTMMMMVVVVV
jgi:hypothetical protein